MIFIKTDEQINIMREGGKLLANLLLEIEQLLKPGVCAKDIDMYAYNYIQKVGGKPSFLNYNGFPASICFSINEVLIHGIPTYDMIVKDGDIVSIDAGIIYRGFHTDAARTFIIGDVPEEIKQLVKVTEDSFFEGIKYAKAGNRLSDISSAIEKLIVKNGFFVVREYVGHGVGRSLHEEPSIPNYGKPGNGPILQKGMTLAIEPMVLMKSPRVATKSDGWTVSSTNGLPTAHYENTIVVT
nr:type I methionyl aminopeptidase [Exilispira sp.]